MEQSGKIIYASDILSGTSQSGKEWRRQNYVLEYADGSIVKKMTFDVFGERIEAFALSVGIVCTVFFDIDAKEYNGKWYNSVSAWKVTKDASEETHTAPAPQPKPDKVIDDDLPF